MNGLSELWYCSRGRPAEPRRVYWNVCLHLAHLEGIFSVHPLDGHLEGELDSVDVAIICEVELRGNASDRRPAVAHKTAAQPRLLVAVQRRKNAPGAASLNNFDI